MDFFPEARPGSIAAIDAARHATEENKFRRHVLWDIWTVFGGAPGEQTASPDSPASFWAAERMRASRSSSEPAKKGNTWVVGGPCLAWTKERWRRRLQLSLWLVNLLERNFAIP